MPAALIPARLADARLAALISFARDKKGVIGKNMNGNRLWLPLLARPTPDYATRSIEGDTIDVADDSTRRLRKCIRRDQQYSAKGCCQCRSQS
jgi:hypothetical protein